MVAPMTQCPCGSGRSLDICCGPYLAGSSAPTAEALMRSRFTAYARGDADYLQRTSAGPALIAFDRADIVASFGTTEWIGLEIRSTEAGGVDDTLGYVSFTARFRQSGKIRALSERSEFRRLGGEWRYCSGEVDVTSERAASVGRNDPCPCGSGKKHKKCCAA
jgi:SEC-C motif-containing protein